MNWATERKSKANSLLHTVSNFEFISPRLPDKVSFSIEATKYQAKEERHQCVPGVKHIVGIKNELQDFRGEIEKYCTDQYSMATTTARKAGIEPSMCIVSQ